MIVFPLVVPFELPEEVLKRVEGVRGIKALVVLAMASLNFSVVPGGIRPDLFVPDPVFSQASLEERQV